MIDQSARKALFFSVASIFLIQAILYFRAPMPIAESRESWLVELLHRHPLPAFVSPTPEKLCKTWQGGTVQDLDCRTGRGWQNDRSYLHDAQALEVRESWQAARLDVLNLQIWLQLALGQLSTESPLYLPLRTIQARSEDLAQRLLLVKSPVTGDSESIESGYRDLFEIQLSLHGMTYSSITGQFSQKKWDFSTLLAKPEVINVKVKNLELCLLTLPWLGPLFAMLLLPLAAIRAGAIGVWVTALMLTWIQLGLYVIADAALHFGQGSPLFFLNPLSYTLERQMVILGFVLTLWVVLMVFPNWLLAVTRACIRHPVWLGLGTSVAIVCIYFLKGPAFGSASLILGMSLVAAQMVTTQARTYFLARKYAAEALSLHSIRSFLLSSKGMAADQALILKHLTPPLLNYFFLTMLVLLLTALVFHDLGGTLIASALVLTALFLSFGHRPTLLAIALACFAAWILSTSEKIQNRVELMLSPMTASISDFARLVGYTESTAQHAHGLGRLKWCNDLGSCLPIQALSDYMPTLVNGLAGIHAAWFLFGIMAAYFLFLCTASCVVYLTRQGPSRMLAMLAFLIALASLIQLALTFLGNWRVIPLTGLGTPFLSIGASSLLTPVLAAGLYLIARFAPEKGLA